MLIDDQIPKNTKGLAAFLFFKTENLQLMFFF